MAATYTKIDRIDCLFCLYFKYSQHTDTHAHRSYVLMTCSIFLISLYSLCDAPILQAIFNSTVKAIQSELMCVVHHSQRSTLYGHVKHRSSHVYRTPVSYRSPNAQTHIWGFETTQIVIGEQKRFKILLYIYSPFSVGNVGSCTNKQRKQTERKSLNDFLFDKSPICVSK